MQIKIIDKYIIKQFFLTFFFGLLVFASIFVVINLIEMMDEFIDKNISGLMVVEYYLVFIPEILKFVIPISVLLSALFVSGKMTSLNEVTAIKAAGVSYYRYIRPFFICSLIVSLFTVYFSGYLVPAANKHKIFIERHHMKKDLESLGDQIYFQDNKNRIVTINFFNTENLVATLVSIQEYSSKDITVMTSRIDAPSMKYNKKKSSWVLMNVVKRNFAGDKETLKRLDSLELSYLNFHPEDVIKKQSKPDEMNLSDLKNYADEQLRSGNDPTRILIEYHSRFAFSFASLVVILFGLTINNNNRKGGVALQFGINLGITFIYLVFFKVSEAFGKNGIIDPMLTAWSANILFASLAVLNLLRIQK